MSLNPDIIQFVTDTTARIHQNYPAATQQQRLILDKNTGQVFWDVNYTRYKVNTTPKISYTVNQDSDALVTGSAVFVHVQDIANELKQQIQGVTLVVDTELSDTSQNPVQNRVIKAGIDLALSDAKQYTDFIISSNISQLADYMSDAIDSVYSDARQYTDLQVQKALSDAKLYIDNIALDVFSDARQYTNSSVQVALSDAKQYVDITVQTSFSDAKQYTNSAIADSVLQLEGYITDAVSDTRQYADTNISVALSDAKQYTDFKCQAVLSDAMQYTDSVYNDIARSYIPISSIILSVQQGDTHIPTGGAVYGFVQSAISQIQQESQSLVGLVDTDINSPADGQVLAYNSNTSKWYNKTIQSGTDGISWTLYVQ